MSSRSTAYRKRKAAFDHGTRSGDSDLSSTPPSSPDPPDRRLGGEPGDTESEDDIRVGLQNEGEEAADDHQEPGDGPIHEPPWIPDDQQSSDDDASVSEEEDSGGSSSDVHPSNSSTSDWTSSDSSSSSDSGSGEEESSSDSEESSDSDDDGANAGARFGDGDRPLYAGARLTVFESIMMVLSLTLSCNISGECLVKVLELVEAHCRADNMCVTTLHKFRKFFQEIGRSILILHYFCEHCFRELPGKNSICRQCQNETKVAFFIEIPILSQLQRMFLRHGFLEKLLFRFTRHKKHPDNIEDIYDSRLYQDHMGPTGLLQNRNNISFMWYSDGVSIFKSSKFSIWPLFLIINELSYKERTKKENILLAGLWFGRHKPKSNLFLKPFKRFFANFKRHGYRFTVPRGPAITVKGLLLCGTCDLQAKAIFTRSTMSNGYFGCTKCVSLGQRAQAGSTTVHVHPYIPTEQIQLRSNNDVPHLARQRRYGYKGLSLLFFMVPNMVRGTAIDSLHMLFLGISKLLTKLWFDTKYSNEPYSCSGMIDLVNERLSQIYPPSFVQRLTRTLIDIHLWKGREHKLWFFYYSVTVLSGVLENVYLQHHLKLVSAVALLSQDSISLEQINAAEMLLHEYVRDFEILYTVRYMGMNIHLLLHLADMVRDLGNLWIYSCFFTEDLNGEFVKFIHAPNQPGLQVCSTASLYLSLQTKIESLQPDSIARKYCERVHTGGLNYKVAEHVSEKLQILGKSAFHIHVSEATRQVLRNCLNIEHGHFQTFFSIRKRGVIYDCERKVRSLKRCSLLSSFLVDGEVVLGKIKEYVRRSECECQGICLCVPAHYFCIVQRYERIPWHAFDVPNVRLPYLSAVQECPELFACPCDSIMSLCFHWKVRNTEYIASPVNSLEYE